MIEIDGATGEGGGQILRSALSLSICTAESFRIVDIRANRERPGLMRQHLVAVEAAAEISGARVTGATIGSRELTFEPEEVKPGDYEFAIGTAGSCTLVLQTVLPPLGSAKADSRIRITGGTHNIGAPPFDFLVRAYLPLLARMGPRVQLELVRHGFHPRGGGELRAAIHPAALTRLDLDERGAYVDGYAESYVAALPLHVAERELAVVRRALDWPPEHLHVRALPNDVGPGNLLAITLVHANVTEVITGFGEKGVTAERVAKGAVEEACAYLDSDAAVGPQLADQLLLPMALAGGGSFTTVSITDHFRSHAEVIARFLDRRVSTEQGQRSVRVSVS